MTGPFICAPAPRGGVIDEVMNVTATKAEMILEEKVFFIG